MNEDDMRDANEKAYAFVKGKIRENAMMLDMDEDTVEQIGKMCDESVVMANSMFTQLNQHFDDPEKLKEGLDRDGEESAPRTIRNTSGFLLAIRKMADRMEELGLRQNRDYLNVVADRYAKTYKKNHKAASYLLLWMISVIMKVLENATEMRDMRISTVERSIRLMNEKDTGEESDHMREWRKMEGLEDED